MKVWMCVCSGTRCPERSRPNTTSWPGRKGNCTLSSILAGRHETTTWVTHFPTSDLAWVGEGIKMSASPAGFRPVWLYWLILVCALLISWTRVVEVVLLPLWETVFNSIVVSAQGKRKKRKRENKPDSKPEGKRPFFFLTACVCFLSFLVKQLRGDLVLYL